MDVQVRGRAESVTVEYDHEFAPFGEGELLQMPTVSLHFEPFGAVPEPGRAIKVIGPDGQSKVMHVDSYKIPGGLMVRSIVGTKMNSADPEPDLGTVVRDDLGVVWEHCEAPLAGDYWLQVEHPDWDPESWIKVAGNYGPVVVVSE